MIRAGIIFYRQAQCDLAIDCWNYTLGFVIKENDKWGESACYTNIALAYFHMKNYRESIKYDEKAVVIDEMLNDKAGLAEGYARLTASNGVLKNYNKCIEYGQKAIVLLNVCGKTDQEQRTCAILGEAYHVLGNQLIAIKYLKIAIEITSELEASGAPIELPKGEILSLLGKCYLDLGDFQSAIINLELAVEPSTVRKKSKVTDYINLAAAYSSIGNFERAIFDCEKALRLAIESSNQRSQSICYLNLGFYYDSLENNDKAIDYYLKSLPLKRAIGDKSGESRCLTNLGEAYRCRGYKEKNAQRQEQAARDFQDSIMHNLMALKIAQEIADFDLVAKSSGDLANTYACMESSHSSITWNLKVLEIATSIGEKQTILCCYSNLSNEYEKLGNEQKALEYAELALSIETNDISIKAALYFRMAQIYFKSNPLRAFNFCMLSLEESKKISAKLVEEPLKISYGSELCKIYQILVPVCLRLGKYEEALKYTEESKSRSQVELLSTTEIMPKAQVTKEISRLLIDEKKCLDRLQQIQMRYLEATAVVIEPDEVQKISDKLSAIYNRLEVLDPEYVSLRRSESLSLDGIKQLLSSLGKKTVLIEYFLTNDDLTIFTLSTIDYELHIKKIELSSDGLYNYIKAFDEEVTLFRKTGKTSERWLGLSKYLIEPVAEFIPEGSTIYFIPDRALHYIPLHALELNGVPLIINHPVAYSSSATLLKLIRKKGTNRYQTCAPFGIKPFDMEAKKVANFFRTKAYIDSEATIASVFDNQDNDIIHISCHGEFDLDNPHISGITMFDGSLTVKDILKMRLNTELVTLSACCTGLSRYTHGNEMIGFTRAVLYAGAPSVVVSLWSVYGPSTEDLMYEFYSYLTGQNIEHQCSDKAVALQQAQINLMKKYPHPFYWAPFILIGKL